MLKDTINSLNIVHIREHTYITSYARLSEQDYFITPEGYIYQVVNNNDTFLLGQDNKFLMGHKIIATNNKELQKVVSWDSEGCPSLSENLPDITLDLILNTKKVLNS